MKSPELTEKQIREALPHLQNVIYHKLMMWDASSAAEEALGMAIDTESDSMEGLCVGLNLPGDALDLTWSDLARAFDLEEAAE